MSEHHATDSRAGTSTAQLLDELDALADQLGEDGPHYVVRRYSRGYGLAIHVRPIVAPQVHVVAASGTPYGLLQVRGDDLDQVLTDAISVCQSVAGGLAVPA